MADRSAIEWTDATWNPIRARNRTTGKLGWHCEHATTGCVNCYAEGFNRRLGTGFDFKPGHLDNGDIELFLDGNILTQPLRWKKPRTVFVCSMTDLFARFVKDEWIDKIFAVMALCPQHTFQVLTKRTDRMLDHLGKPLQDRKARNETRPAFRAQTHIMMAAAHLGVPLRSIPDWPLPNVWLGVSAERQAEADERIPHLIETPARIKFISAEPLLGPIDFRKVPGFNRVNLSLWNWWVIAGGESGAAARPMHPAWARSLRDQCAGAGVPFFFKQWGEWRLTPAANGDETWPAPWDGARTPRKNEIAHMERLGKANAGRLLDGVEHNAMPEVIR